MKLHRSFPFVLCTYVCNKQKPSLAFSLSVLLEWVERNLLDFLQTKLQLVSSSRTMLRNIYGERQKLETLTWNLLLSCSAVFQRGTKEREKNNAYSLAGFARASSITSRTRNCHDFFFIFLLPTYS